MRLFEAVRRFLRPALPEIRPDWKATERTMIQYNPAMMAEHLNEKKPFFRMRSGGVYAVATVAGKPSHFIRVDKDRRTPKVRKRSRRAARELVAATT